jgi:hypothetical protein
VKVEPCSKAGTTGGKEGETWQRLQILWENFAPSVEGIEPHQIEVLAQLGSRLPGDEERAEIDHDLVEGQPIAEKYRSHVDKSSIPWQGEMADLERKKLTNVTYRDAVGEIATGLAKLNQERLREGATEIESEFHPGPVR